MAVKEVLVFLGLCVFGVFASPSSVPAVIWTNNLSHQFPSSLAGHTTSGDVFANYIHNSLTGDHQNLIVFLQDKLNLEDLSQHADDGTFKNLKTLLGTQVSAHLSGVASPTDALGKLKQQFAGKVHEVTPTTKVDNLPMSDEGHDMLVVHLPATGQGQIENTLKESDSIIGSVMSKLQDSGKKYTAVYTAKESSQVPDESMYLGRHLLAEAAAADNSTSTFLNVSCVFFYVSTMTLKVDGEGSYKLPPLVDRQYPNGSCFNNTASLNITFPNEDLPEGLQNFSLVLNFKTVERQWKLTQALLNFATVNGTEETDLVLSDKYMYAPYRQSYHCGIDHRLRNNDNTTNTTTTVIFNGLQVQVGRIDNNKFGRSNDCIGFFTIPIWAGLIVGLLLVSILAFGVTMLLMMNSIERFDDPKGKTITINVTD